MSKTDLSRRCALTLIAGTTVVSTTAAVSTPSLATSENPDAELIALNAQLDEIIRELIYIEVTDLGEDSDDIVSEFGHRKQAIISRVLLHPAQTIEGLAVQTKAISLDECWMWSNGGDMCHPHMLDYLNSACKVLNVVPAFTVFLEGKNGGAAVPLVCRQVQHEEDDPIFAAIERHKRAEAAFNEWGGAQGEGFVLKAAASVALAEEMVALAGAVCAAREELWRVAPTTPAGLVAYLDYLVAASEELEEFACDGEAETMDFLRTLARATRGMVGQLNRVVS